MGQVADGLYLQEVERGLAFVVVLSEGDAEALQSEWPAPRAMVRQVARELVALSPVEKISRADAAKEEMISDEATVTIGCAWCAHDLGC